METIAACAPVYGSSALTPYAEELWSGLQNEVKQESKEVEKLGCFLLTFETYNLLLIIQ